MSSIEEDRIKEWESRLPEAARQTISQEMEEITALMDEIVKREDKLDSILKRFASKLIEMGLPPEYVSTYLKHILRGIVSERTIERSLGEEQKRKYKRYQPLEIRQGGEIPPKKEIEVSSTGTESYTKADGTEGQREEEITAAPPSAERQQLEHLYERMQDNELERKLREEIADKDKALEQERLRNGELDVRCNALDKQISDLKQQQKAGILRSKEYQDLLIASQQQEQRINQLEEIETKRVKERDFVSAASASMSNSNKSKEIWIDPADALRMYARMRAVLDKRVRGFLQYDDLNGKVIDIYLEGQRAA